MRFVKALLIMATLATARAATTPSPGEMAQKTSSARRVSQTLWFSGNHANLLLPRPHQDELLLRRPNSNCSDCNYCCTGSICCSATKVSV